MSGDVSGDCGGLGDGGLGNGGVGYGGWGVGGISGVDGAAVNTEKNNMLWNLEQARNNSEKDMFYELLLSYTDVMA